jgi:GST-like protein
MIDLYTWTTPNGRKVSILLEELGLPYTVKLVNIGKNEQFAPAFLAVSPNNKIPAIVDHDADGGGLPVFESGAILTYLADTYGHAFLPASGAARWKVLEWLAWQVGGLGPMLGQLGYFLRAAEPVQSTIDRFALESTRLLGVMDRRLNEVDYLGGEYSIADMACYPWIAAMAPLLKTTPLIAGWDEMTGIHRWLEALAARPAVQRGMAVPQV